MIDVEKTYEIETSSSQKAMIIASAKFAKEVGHEPTSVKVLSCVKTVYKVKCIDKKNR